MPKELGRQIFYVNICSVLKSNKLMKGFRWRDQQNQRLQPVFKTNSGAEGGQIKPCSIPFFINPAVFFTPSFCSIRLR